MMNLEYAPTIAEIKGVRTERENRRNRLPWFTKFSKNDIVEFTFNGLRKVGRITTVLMSADGLIYHIATRTGQWYRGISQERIIGKVC